jgi:hypothetical protein
MLFSYTLLALVALAAGAPNNPIEEGKKEFKVFLILPNYKGLLMQYIHKVVEYLCSKNSIFLYFNNP